MRSIYAINADIEALIDEETGEIDIEAYEALAAEREEKIESLCLWAKNLKANAAAIREEEKALAERRHAEERKLERLEAFIQDVLDGASFTTPRVAVSYRASEAVELLADPQTTVTELERLGFKNCISYKPAEVNKTELKNVLKRGIELGFAQIVKRSNMSIK